MEALQAELISFLTVFIGVLAGVITKKLASYLNAKGLVVKLKNNREMAKIVVNAVEQMYKELDGKDKLGKAKLELIDVMKEHKIKISEKEVDLLIETIVKEMNQAVKEEIK